MTIVWNGLQSVVNLTDAEMWPGIVNAAVSVGVIIAVVKCGLILISKWDEGILLRKFHWILICSMGVVQSVVIVWVMMRSQHAVTVACTGKGLALSVFGGCLLLACITDLYCCNVYHFTWWIAMVSQMPIWWEWAMEIGAISKQSVWRNGSDSRGMVGDFAELWIFMICQLLLAGRIYGRADGYAFAACAVVLFGFGNGMACFLGQMFFAYALLFCVQLIKGNVSEKGNLKRPVPFLPYITMAFWGAISFSCFS